MKRYFSTLFLLIPCLFTSAQALNNEYIKLVQILNTIDVCYVDTVNHKHIMQTAVNAILKELDPHSSYIPAEDVQRSHEGLNGNFEGIGVQYMMINDTVIIDRTIAGCPAEQVGILPGDRITHVDGKLIAGNKTKFNDIPKMIRGPKGTTVAITIRRPNEKDSIVFKVTRDKIPINSVDAAFYVAPGVGYIKVTSFSLTTPEEFSIALDSLKKGQRLKSLIIDLQSNGGGIMQSAEDMVSCFLPHGRDVVSVRGAHVQTQTTLSSGHKPLDIPLYVLIDEYTASASEIVAGALQDWDRATIIGRRSFGKGLVQRPLAMQDGSELRLTIARYYTPSGRNIQKPYDGGTDKYFHDIEQRYKKGELVNPDSVQFPDSLKYYTRLKHRTVYGGGGIFPDVFVPLDTTKVTTLYRQLYNKGALSRGVKSYVNSHRRQMLRRNPDFNSYKTDMPDIQPILDSILKIAKEEKIEYTDEQLNETMELLTMQIRANTAQSLYGNEYFYHIIYPLNDALSTALKLINKE